MFLPPELDDFCSVTRSIMIETAELPLHIVTARSELQAPDAAPSMVPSATGCGIATSKDLAELKARAECLEALHYLQPTTRPTRRTDEPLSMLLPLEAHAGGPVLSTLRAWPAINFRTSERLVIPEQMLFASVPDREPLIRRESNSSGTAFGPVGTNRAARSGLLELVERDAVFGAWLSRKRLPILHKVEDYALSQMIDRTEPKEAEENGVGSRRFPEHPCEALIRGVHSLGIETLFLDATSDVGLPTSICVCSRNGGQLSFGTACDVTMPNAMEKALLEAIQIRPFLEEYPLETMEQILMGRDFMSYNATDTAYFWWLKGTLGEIVSILVAPKSEPQARVVTPKDGFPDLALHLLNQNMELFVADLSSDWLNQSGWEVVRVLVPELLSAFTRQRHRPEEHRRWGDLRGAPDLPVPFA